MEIQISLGKSGQRSPVNSSTNCLAGLRKKRNNITIISLLFLSKCLIVTEIGHYLLFVLNDAFFCKIRRRTHLQLAKRTGIQHLMIKRLAPTPTVPIRNTGIERCNHRPNIFNKDRLKLLPESAFCSLHLQATNPSGLINKAPLVVISSTLLTVFSL
ncbi:hypothetical protein CLV42_101666 [Chitinophaga ginsengisoli]|uniref:Uncharacterized protein n=1 Tax=Chitinophaga ginsengisoli TaxID=363837 RepID=A0A2P8GPM6_9BACT|nr:hypothetical protein CLV42_101666 [Chitinophaga ginsengisoli]